MCWFCVIKKRKVREEDWERIENRPSRPLYKLEAGWAWKNKVIGDNRGKLNHLEGPLGWVALVPMVGALAQILLE